MYPGGQSPPLNFTRFPPLGTRGDGTSRKRLENLIGSNNTALVPYNYEQGTGNVDDRLQSLESRLILTERANNALVEEVMRIQGDLQNSIRRAEEGIREERTARQMTENTFRGYQDTINQLANRLIRSEDILNEERRQLKDLQAQSQSMDNIMSSSKQDLNSIRDRYINRISVLEASLSEISRNQQKYERSSLELVDEMRSMKAVLDAHGMDMSSISQELRSKSRRLEDDYQYGLDAIRKQLDRQGDVSSSGSGRGLVEQRLDDMLQLMTQLRKRHEEEVSERRTLEQSIHTRTSELTRTLTDQARQRDEALFKVTAAVKEREHRQDTERLKLENRIAEAVEQINVKLLEKELQMRDEQTRRLNEIEKIIQKEQDARRTHERDLREDKERQWAAIQKIHTEDVSVLKESQKAEKVKYIESIKNLDQGVSLLEKQLSSLKKEMGAVLQAEIKTRATKDRHAQERFTELEEKIHLATTALQTAISGVSASHASHTKQLRQVVDAAVMEHKKELRTELGDMDVRIQSINSRVSGIDQIIDRRLDETLLKMSGNIREKVESISLWQATVNTNVIDLKTENENLSNKVHELEEALNLLKSEVQSRLAAEVDGRIQDVNSVRRALELLRESIPAKDAFATKLDMEQCTESIKKLAQAVQTVKTVLGMKIQSEQNLRVEEVKNLQDEVIRLHSIIEPFIHVDLPARLFIKPDKVIGVTREQQEARAPTINKWSIYTAYRWLSFMNTLNDGKIRARNSIMNRDNAEANDDAEPPSQVEDEAEEDPKPPPSQAEEEDPEPTNSTAAASPKPHDARSSQHPSD